MAFSVCQLSSCSWMSYKDGNDFVVRTISLRKKKFLLKMFSAPWPYQKNPRKSLKLLQNLLPREKWRRLMTSFPKRCPLLGHVATWLTDKDDFIYSFTWLFKKTKQKKTKTEIQSPRNVSMSKSSSWLPRGLLLLLREEAWWHPCFSFLLCFWKCLMADGCWEWDISSQSYSSHSLQLCSLWGHGLSSKRRTH